MYEDTLRDFAESSIVTGRVIEVRPNEVLVDIGYKSEGTLPASEFRGDTSQVQPGDQFEVLIEKLEDDEGMVCLSKTRAEQQRKWENVVNNCSEGSTIPGEVKGRVKGGLIIDIGVDAFLPGSQVDITPVRNPDELVGQTLEFKIIKINKERRNVVLSRRELMEDRRREARRELLRDIRAGQVRKGMVKNITEFGAFIDLQGMDGLLHITDMSWGRLNHPSEMVSVGQELEVVVLDVDLEKERISLGLKQRSGNPWDGIEGRYPVNSRIHGKVVSLVPYGAFVEIEPGVEGLVHVSEMSWTKRVAKASDVLNVGDEVDAIVLAVNAEEQKISLGIRQTEANPWDTVLDRYPIGSRVKGKVRNFTTYGAFVEIEPGMDGMIHVSDMSWTRKVNHPSEVLKKSDEVECVVLEVDPTQQRISLGLKQAQQDPWSGIQSRFRIGQMVKGKVSKVASFGAFVELAEGIDGLVHISQISDERVQKVRDVLQPGQEVEARVIKIDSVDRKIGLSIKAAQVPEENFVVSEEMLQGLRPGEDLVDIASALDEAFGTAGGAGEEWHPGQKKPEET
ncbi:MAG: 30S ribosomal protein S1 [Lentisphaerae bacterium]|nr:30S ribosomal protein S1 [Lentisphaerota bacterium]